MNNFFDTIIPLSKTAFKLWRISNPCNFFPEQPENNTSTHYITKHYEQMVTETLTENEDIQRIVDYILRNLLILINRYKLTDKTNQKLIFDQIIIFINYLYNELRTKYLYNTLTNNNLRDFNKRSIGNKVNGIIRKKGESSYSGSFCVHYALLFKHIFDEIEKNFKLGTSNYLFLEKIKGVNHAGLVVTFQGENYLVDSSFFNYKCMQLVKELGENYDRMKILSSIHTEDISPDYIQKTKYEYNNCDNCSKAILKDSNDLLELLDTAPIKAGNFLRNYNIFNKNVGVYFNITNKGILILNRFFYHFDHSFNKEELDKISDDELINFLTNSILYKTNKNDKNKKIKVFNLEKKYIRETLSYFSDKIDFTILRKILCNN